MQEKKFLSFHELIAIGSLLFGMLFGAGNLIFPPILGQNAGASYVPAALGFLVTAVGLPVLAIISFALSRKTTLRGYAERAGKGFGLAFSLLLLLSIGPFFAIPRNTTVAFTIGIAPLIHGEQSLYLFFYSLAFFLFVLFFSLRPSKILDVVGKVMAPLFIFLIALLILKNLFMPMGNPAQFPVQEAYAIPFEKGVLDGYQTMDLLACLAFGITIISNIQLLGVKDSRRDATETAKSSVFTLIVMSLIYFGLSYLGASCQGSMEAQKNGGEILVRASLHHFGTFGQILLALTITIACLKTAIGLVVSLSQTFVNFFPNGPRDKTWSYLFVIISFIFANFGLNTIIQLSLPVLMFLYPLSMTLIALWLLDAILPLRDKAFVFTIILAIIPAIFDFLAACPSVISQNAGVKSLLSLPKGILPLYDLGLGWLLPVSLGLVISAVFLRAPKAAKTV